MRVVSGRRGAHILHLRNEVAQPSRRSLPRRRASIRIAFDVAGCVVASQRHARRQQYALLVSCRRFAVAHSPWGLILSVVGSLLSSSSPLASASFQGKGDCLDQEAHEIRKPARHVQQLSRGRRRNYAVWRIAVRCGRTGFAAGTSVFCRRNGSLRSSAAIQPR